MESVADGTLASPTHDYTVWQARLERWLRMEELLQRAQHAGEPLQGECIQAAAAELHALQPGEHLWAYPGPRRLARLRLHLGHQQLDEALADARQIVRMLHLHGDAAAFVDGGDPEAWESYRTVLVVSRRARNEVTALKRVLAPKDAPVGGIVYELIAATSLEEAVAAVRYNPYVEVCLLGDDVPLRAAHAVLGEAERAALNHLPQAELLPTAWFTRWLRAAQPRLVVQPLASPVEDLRRAIATRI